MKKTEIAEIIETNPETIFTTSSNYRQFFQITGFTTKQKYTYRNGTGTGATAVAVRYFTCYWSDSEQDMVLREGSNGVLTLTQVGAVYTDSIDKFVEHQTNMHHNTVARAKRQHAQGELARETAPALRAALDNAGLTGWQVMGYTGDDGTTLKLTPQQMVLMVELLNKATAE